MKFIRALAITAFLLFGTTQVWSQSIVTYYMNGPDTSTIDQSATITTNTVPLSATPFASSTNITVLNPGSNASPTGSGTNNAVRFNSVSTPTTEDFTFSITNTSASQTWQLINVSFDVRQGTGVGGTVAWFFNANQVATGTITAGGGSPGWATLALIPSSTLLGPSGVLSVDLQINFSGNGTIDFDNIIVSGTDFVAVPEPATIAMMGGASVLAIGGWCIRRRRQNKLLNAALRS